jgi:Glucodextranase, domain N
VTDAPGSPGMAPRWTSSAKSGIGTALSPVSRVWFTLSHGILDEIYYPRVDQACTRDFGMIVTGADGFFAEEKRHCASEIAGLEDGVPAFRLVNTHVGGRFRIIKDILTDPRADVVVQQIRLEVLSGPSAWDRGTVAAPRRGAGASGPNGGGWGASGMACRSCPADDRLSRYRPERPEAASAAPFWTAAFQACPPGRRGRPPSD